MYYCDVCGERAAPIERNFTNAGGLVCDECTEKGLHPDAEPRYKIMMRDRNGTEEIDTAATETEAQYLAAEYRLAFHCDDPDTGIAVFWKEA